MTTTQHTRTRAAIDPLNVYPIGTGLAFLAVAGLVLISLKLCGVIPASWLWVTVPFWILPAGMLAIYIVGLAIGALGALIALGITLHEKWSDA